MRYCELGLQPLGVGGTHSLTHNRRRSAFPVCPTRRLAPHVKAGIPGTCSRTVWSKHPSSPAICVRFSFFVLMSFQLYCIRSRAKRFIDFKRTLVWLSILKSQVLAPRWAQSLLSKSLKRLSRGEKPFSLKMCSSCS